MVYNEDNTMDDLETLNSELLSDLAKMLTEASGLQFVVNGENVEPAPHIKKDAEFKEFGSSILGIKPEPFYHNTIAKWKSKYHIN